MSESENTTPAVNENHAKMRWIGNGMMNGNNADIIADLLATLPGTDSLDAAGAKQLELARLYMLELWARGISKNEFFQETGLTGAPKDVLPAGFSKQQVVFGEPIYFKLFLSEKDASVCAAGLKELLLGRLNSMGEWANQFRMLFFVDIDSDNKEFPSPYQSGLTTHAVCFDVGMDDVESCFATIDKATTGVVENAARNVRIGIGQFGPQEYVGMRNGYLFTKRMSFNMGSEWILVKNIARRAGKLGWFWRFMARRYERFDNP
ncbi:MAG: hypothetical protein P4L53_04345 [Candidatus Obscuribacterales bacterium]|nr:hypothetical protein [Candidatus Obscuribacterales bacterium]